MQWLLKGVGGENDNTTMIDRDRWIERYSN
jgi:hypothetical protein